ncbi:31328_t:CDS:2, partial [Gigaspora margarita]
MQTKGYTKNHEQLLLTQFVTSIDIQFDKNKSEPKVKYRTKGNNYQILRDDVLFDSIEKAKGYFKYKNCIGKTQARFCSRNHHIQTFIAQIDSLILLKEGKEIPQKFYNKSYYSFIKSYPALGQILEAVETNELEDWIGKLLMSISTLLVRWITTNLASPTIRLIHKKRNKNNEYFDVHRINSSVFAEPITIWQSAYNYYSLTICAKDQTKVAEMIE